MPTIATTTVLEWNDGQPRTLVDDLAGEEPLEIRVGAEPLGVTMRTPGKDAELVAGFLWTERIIDEPGQLKAIEAVEASSSSTRPSNVVRAVLDPAPSHDVHRVARRFTGTSSCGVCGRASIESLRAAGLVPPQRTFGISPRDLCAWPGQLRSAQQVFDRTGGLHAAALFDSGGRLLAIREDIGRHNAVDKVVGWAVLGRRVPLSGHGLLVSGRGGFEIVQKAVASGVELLACVSAPSNLAVQLAREFGLTLVGFLRGSRFVVYAGEDRIRPPAPAPQ